LIEAAIVRRENEGYRRSADWWRMFLCEIYLEIISGTEKPPAKVLVRNILTLVAVMFTAEKRICALVERIRQPPSCFWLQTKHVARSFAVVDRRRKHDAP
jgi:hypothetical protein